MQLWSPSHTKTGLLLVASPHTLPPPTHLFILLLLLHEDKTPLCIFLRLLHCSSLVGAVNRSCCLQPHSPFPFLLLLSLPMSPTLLLTWWHVPKAPYSNRGQAGLQSHADRGRRTAHPPAPASFCPGLQGLPPPADMLAEITQTKERMAER